MKSKRTLVVLFMFVVTLNGLIAQDRSFPYDLKKKDLLLLPLGFGMTLLGSFMCDSYGHISPREIGLLNRNDVNALDRCATYNWSPHWGDRSDLYRDIMVFSSILALSVPPLLHAKLSETATVGTMCVESCLLLSGFTLMTKATVGRKRPYLYNTNLSIEERQSGEDNAYLSFFSGHTAAAFAAATFLSKVITDIHGDSIWTKLLWGSSLTLASMTGYARVKAGKHYPTDVIAGAIAGFAIGYLVPVLHKKKRDEHVTLIISPQRVGISVKF
jgi:membrane-associated phospholipid phosphatase